MPGCTLETKTVEMARWSPVQSNAGTSNEMTENALIVFDLGGTWFRSALLVGNQLKAHRKEPAINYVAFPDLDIYALQRKLVDYLVDETRRLLSPNDIVSNAAVVSIGAALDGRTGRILNSGPLWGPQSRPFDLRRALGERLPWIEWQVVNDVTAALLRHVYEMDLHAASRVTLLTVSTGVAARTYDSASGAIPLDRFAGLQGEIGHNPVVFEFRARTHRLVCDCGGVNHLNAFSSGRGVVRVIRQLATSHFAEFRANGWNGGEQHCGDAEIVDWFSLSLARRRPLAIEILDAIIAPLAQTIVTMLATDPLIEKLILTGGVVRALSPYYVDALRAQLKRIGMYQVSELEPDFFDKLLVTGIDDDVSGLVGAGLSFRSRKTGKFSFAANGKTSWKVVADNHISYNIIQVEGLLDPANDALTRRCGENLGSRRRLVFIDARVAEIYGPAISDYFAERRYDVQIATLPGGEASKDINIALEICDKMDRFGLDRRNEPVIVFGGGVLLDLVGFAASLYRRGTPFVRVPTTLMGYIDAGVGIKTGVNYNGTKNKLGSYYAPGDVLLDRHFLRSVDLRHVRNGTAEIVKIGIIRDRRLFDLIDRHGERLIEEKFQDSVIAAKVLNLAIANMLDELAENLWEKNLERLMDFGHSFSPKFELLAEPQLLHGEAVAIDMALSTIIARRRRLLVSDAAERIVFLLVRLGLPVFHPVCGTEVMWEAIEAVKRHRGGYQRVSLPVAIGRGQFVNDITRNEVAEALSELSAWDGAKC